MHCFIDTRSAKQYLRTLLDQKINHQKIINGLDENSEIIDTLVHKFHKLMATFDSIHKEVIGCDELRSYEYEIRNF